MRNAYLLTCNPNSDRAIFSKSILEDIGFNVIFFQAIPHENPLLSHRQSMIQLYAIIANDVNSGDNDWSYVFEDDINKLDDIKLDEIIQYEAISDKFFYLGLCKYGENAATKTNHSINGHNVYSVSGCVRGLHAVAFSKTGMRDFINFINIFKIEYIDMILELYSTKYPANVIRFDLESYIMGHRGVIFQDRKKFQSIIGT